MVLGSTTNTKTQQHHSCLCSQFKITNTFRVPEGLSVNDHFLEKHLKSLKEFGETLEYLKLLLHGQFCLKVQCPSDSLLIFWRCNTKHRSLRSNIGHECLVQYHLRKDRAWKAEGAGQQNTQTAVQFLAVASPPPLPGAVAQQPGCWMLGFFPRSWVYLAKKLSIAGELLAHSWAPATTWSPLKYQCGLGLAQVIPEDNNVLSCLLLPEPTSKEGTPRNSQSYTFTDLLELPCTCFIFSSASFPYSAPASMFQL